MNGKIDQFELMGRRCAIWLPEGTGPFPAAVLCGGDLGENLAELSADHPPLALISLEGDWETDYTPWQVEPLPGRRPFAGGADSHLSFLLDEGMPWLRARYPLKDGPKSTAILGYSLGGLFALWAFYESGAFGVSGSISGSLWYEGWTDYARSHMPPQHGFAYLSLGKAEEGGKGRMGTVGERTRETAELLAASLGAGSVSLVYNRGGHFTGTVNRWRKAIDWAAQHLG